MLIYKAKDSQAPSHWEVLYMNTLIGANDHSGEPQNKKKSHSIYKKGKEERRSNIFSPNYSVGTVLCTVECPGSGMAWRAQAGAKPHPPHIVLTVDFLHFFVCVCEWCVWVLIDISSATQPTPSFALLTGKTISTTSSLSTSPNSELTPGQICRDVPADFFLQNSLCWYKVGGKISQPGTNVSSYKVYEFVFFFLNLSPALLSCMKGSTCSRMLCQTPT